MAKEIIIRTTKENRFGQKILLKGTFVEFDKKGFAKVSTELSSLIDNKTIYLSNEEMTTIQTKDELIDELRLSIEALSQENEGLREELNKVISEKASISAQLVNLKAREAGSSPAEDVKEPKALSQMNKTELISVAEELTDVINIEEFKELTKKDMVEKLESLLK